MLSARKKGAVWLVTRKSSVNLSGMGLGVAWAQTVGAAMEGYLFGIPAIAFSQTEKGWAHIEDAARVS